MEEIRNFHEIGCDRWQEPPRYTLESTLRELTLYDGQLTDNCLGADVRYLLEANEELPGAILLTQDRKLLGFISRRRFLEQLRRPFGKALFLQRPARFMLACVPQQPLVLPCTMPIQEAAWYCLQRSPNLLDEPIVVEVGVGEYRLVAPHQLLVAQTSIHELTAKLLTNLYSKVDALNQELWLRANLDSLTQLTNRRCFDEILHREWRRLAREDMPLSAIMCDVDCFKSYNDTYGHPTGDECLQRVARVLRLSAKRPADVVARYGGEEFVLLLPQTHLSGAVRVAQEIWERMQTLAIPHARSAASRHVTLSMGIASIVPHSQLSPDTLLAAADEALYQAKANGRNTYTVFAETISSTPMRC